VVPVKVGKEKEGFSPQANGRTVILTKGVDQDGGVGDLVD